MTKRYSFDTSALIGAWERRLPRDVVPSFWRALELLIADGAVNCIDEVERELDRRQDDLRDWARGQPRLVVPLSQNVLEAARVIINAFPLVKPGKGRNGADPFVIALAQVSGGTVVTEETHTGPIKIPHVCEALNVECIDVYGFVRQQRWSF